jgi:hypothetical protein
MIDETAMAEAVGTPHSPSAETSATEAPSEPPRAAIDRAFAAVEDNERDQGGDADEGEALLSASEAPARFSADAKAAWDQAPAAIRTETLRALGELEGGLSRYQQAFEPLKPYFALARQHNTTLHEAMERYTALDQALLSDDPRSRLTAIARVLDHAGLSPADYANFVLGQHRPAPEANERPFNELRRELADLRHELGGVTSTLAERQHDEIAREVEAFARDHPRLNDNDFARTVGRLIATGMADDLKAAYDMADRLKPASPQKFPADQTRKGQLSITGAPVSGSNPSTRKPPQTARESLDRSFASLGLG